MKSSVVTFMTAVAASSVITLIGCSGAPIESAEGMGSDEGAATSTQKPTASDPSNSTYDAVLCDGCKTKCTNTYVRCIEDSNQCQTLPEKYRVICEKYASPSVCTTNYKACNSACSFASYCVR